ncbi:methyl-accepting chemotaxis protein [Gorillibacterium timonense]|uniref:methyl-accepting chemotaxis protein n=1 Tax=Gorillibacterium timonense TaxID=1689269 RepID=UPI00071D7722|nr:methyl-accepting chemotaxis protein [Gorillibacterium timonense]
MKLSARFGKLRHSLMVRYALGFFAVIVIFCASSTFTLIQVRTANGYYEERADKTALKQSALEVKVLIQQMKDLSSGYMLSREEQYADAFNEKRPELDALVKRIGTSAESEDGRKRRGKFNSSVDTFIDTFDRALFVVKESGMQESDIARNLQMVYSESQEARDAVFEYVDAYYAEYTSAEKTAIAESEKRMGTTAEVMAAAPVLTALVSILIAFLLIRSFIRPVRRLELAVKSVADGDLNHLIESKAKNELGRLSGSFDSMTLQMKEMVLSSNRISNKLTGYSYELKQFSQITASESEEMAQNISGIAEAAGKQAAGAESIVRAISELKKDMHRIGEATEIMERAGTRAEQVTEQSGEASRSLQVASQQSDASIRTAVTSMKELSAGSGRIGEMIRFIGEIAKQTQILSLNAAIEAARAGEHGKGFLVIADEVRKLSVETSQSASHIAELAEGLLRQTEQTEINLLQARDRLHSQNNRAEEAIRDFLSIGNEVAEISGMIRQIRKQVQSAEQETILMSGIVEDTAAAAEQTAAGAEETNAVVVRQNEAVLQVAGQAEELHDLASELRREIGRFQVEDLHKDSKECTQ